MTVGGHRAAHPLAYTPLLYGRPVFPPAAVWNHRDVLIGIDLAGETPWTYWGSAEYIPLAAAAARSRRRVGAGGPAQAAMIASDLHPGGRVARSGGTSAATVAAVIAIVVAIAAVLVMALRRRPWRRARVA